MPEDKRNLSSRLNQRVTIETQPRPQDVNDESEPLEQWQAVAKVWAEVLTLSGRQFELAQQQVAGATHAVTIRWRAGVTAKMRVNWRGELLHIGGKPVDPDGLRIELRLLCYSYG